MLQYMFWLFTLTFYMALIILPHSFFPTLCTIQSHSCPFSLSMLHMLSYYVIFVNLPFQLR